MPDESPKTPAQRVRELYRDNIGFWQPRRDAMDELEKFLGGERYQEDTGAYNRDRRLVQIRGQECQDTIRHIAAKATERPRSVEARAIDVVEDPDTGELAAALVENNLADPWRGFEDCYESAILSCREKRLGVVMMDWVPDCGPFGEILDRYVDPRRVMWDPAYEDPHHPLCGWLLEEKRLDVDRARETYKAPWLQADREAYTHSGEYKPGVPLLTLGADRLPHTGTPYRDNKVTLWLCWYKNDKSMKLRDGDYSEIEDPEQRYMICKGGCGYRSDTQGELRAAERLEMEIPEELPQGCPTCGGDLERIDARSETQTVRAYEKGKRLVITSPLCAAPDDKAVYDGKWPIPKARSFPIFVITAYQKPGEPVGPCDTDQMWDQQTGLDQLRTIGIQRVFEHRNYWEMPLTGVFDGNRQRYEFREDQFNVMYRDASQAFQSEVKLHQGTGLDPSWQIIFGATQDALTRYRPQLDIGSADENTRNIPVGTIERITSEAETSTEHFKRRLHRALGKYYGVRWDYIRATYTPARLERLNIDGIEHFMNLAGDDLPNFDFVLSDTPPFTGLEKARSEAFQGLMTVFERALAMGLNPVRVIGVYAKINNLPRSVVREFEQMFNEMQAKAAATAELAASVAGDASGEPPLEDEGMGELIGMNGGGDMGSLSM